MSTFGSAVGRLSPAHRLRREKRIAPVRLRLRVLAHHERLDGLLEQGADPVADPALTLRAFQLTRLSHRARVADSLEGAIASAATRRRRSPSAPPLARESVAAARTELLTLARTLRGEPIVAPRGVVLARQLLTDGSGPLYVECADGALRCETESALAALHTR